MRYGGVAWAPALVVLVALVGGVACADPSVGGPGALSADERAAIAAEVRDAVDAFARAERRRDTETIVGFVAPGFYMYGDGVRSDYETVTAQMRATIPTLRRFDTTWSDVEVNVLGRDHAFTSMLFQDAITDAQGVTTRLRGPSTMVWRRIDGAWRIIYVDADHYPEPPP